MPWLMYLLSTVAFLFALLIGTLVEYIVHRLMHAGKLFYKIHAQHHQLGEGQGWFWEFRDYFLPSLPISIGGAVLLGWLGAWPAGISFAAGCLMYAALAAYAHQVQHENPRLCFWMRQPVHHLHHHGRMWHHNFGILVDIWDRVFGTYRAVEREPDNSPSPRLKDYFRIKWF